MRKQSITGSSKEKAELSSSERALLKEAFDVYAAGAGSKMLYLAMMDIIKKWTGHRQDWGQIHSRLEIYFEERLSGRNL